MKNILFGSVVAATLVLSGCGSSSSNDDKNITTPETTPEKNTTTPEKNTTTPPVAEAGTVTVGDLTWTVLKNSDDNDTVSGRQTWAKADEICKGMNRVLPTLAQLKVDASALKTNSTFRASDSNNTVVWSAQDGHGYYFNGLVDSNESEDTEDYTDSLTAGAGGIAPTTYYTCVKAK